jgi:solute carrier family 35 (UDP-galactose transporter), member B1
MFSNNLFGLVVSMMIYAFEVQNYGDDSHNTILGNPKLLYESVMLGLCGSIGQVFIFLTVSLFDCYLLTIITTTRKFFSVVYSNFKFGHNFNEMQWIGALMVMACTFVELFSKEKKKVP